MTDSEKFQCECLKCGYKFTSDTHCVDTKCPKCGGEMRRAERPGDGKENRAEESDGVTMAVWDTAFINTLPNSSFAVVEPAYSSGKTKDKNARHLPYKDASGKVDLPHLRNARARMNQIIPVTDSISTEALRAKAKKVLDAAAKKYLGKKQEMSDDLIHLSMDKPSKIELVEDNSELSTYKIKFELIDIGEYNKFDFTSETLDYMVKAFAEDDVEVVSHGLDHSVKTLEQLGRVYDVQRVEENGKSKVVVFSELFKETEAQKQAHILFRQGLLNFVSGGWKPKSFIWNDEKNNITIVEPKLKEVSSTPVPAKRDAKALEILNSLTHSPNNENEGEQDDIEMTQEDKDMSDENPEIEPSDEGKEVSETSAKLAALETEYKAKIEAVDTFIAEKKAKADAEHRVGLLERAKELGLSEELFKDSTNDAIDLALKAAKETQVSELQKREPVNPLGGEGDTKLADGSPEMIELLEKKYFDWGDIPNKAVN